MAALRVVIVEDDPLLRTSVAAALQLQGVDVVGTTDNAHGATSLVRQCRPQAVILDLDLGVGPTGLDIAQVLRGHHPDIGIIILTAYEDPRLAGAVYANLPQDAEYVVKQSLPDAALLARIVARSVARMTDPAMKKSPPLAPRNGHGLSDTQIEVLRLVAMGMSNAEIGRARHVSAKSVEHTVGRLARKLGIETSDSTNTRVLLARRYYELMGAKL